MLINHGANDRFSSAEAFRKGYRELLDAVTAHNRNSRIIVLSPFCGAHEDTLEKLVKEYNAHTGIGISFIRTTNWIPEAPLHPDRKGHREISRRLAAELQELGI